MLQNKSFSSRRVLPTNRNAVRNAVGPEKQNGTVTRAIQASPSLVLEGISSHFANIEDTTDHTYAGRQLKTFQANLAALAEAGIDIPLRHMSCSAAAMLFPKTHFEMARVGIGLYGLWPSRETYVSCLMQKKEPIHLQPVLSWKARIAQLKSVPAASWER